LIVKYELRGRLTLRIKAKHQYTFRMGIDGVGESENSMNFVQLRSWNRFER
jgi:hypothetical protein